MISLIPCGIKDTKEMVEYIAQDLLKHLPIDRRRIRDHEAYF